MTKEQMINLLESMAIVERYIRVMENPHVEGFYGSSWNMIERGSVVRSVSTSKPYGLNRRRKNENVASKRGCVNVYASRS
jgi:hypothetical protein